MHYNLYNTCFYILGNIYTNTDVFVIGQYQLTNIFHFGARFHVKFAVGVVFLRLINYPQNVLFSTFHVTAVQECN